MNHRVLRASRLHSVKKKTDLHVSLHQEATASGSLLGFLSLCGANNCQHHGGSTAVTPWGFCRLHCNVVKPGQGLPKTKNKKDPVAMWPALLGSGRWFARNWCDNFHMDDSNQNSLQWGRNTSCFRHELSI